MDNIPSKRARNSEECSPLINKVLPIEVLKKIMGQLNVDGVSSARQTCSLWKKIIDGFDIMEEASSMTLDFFHFSGRQ